MTGGIDGGIFVGRDETTGQKMTVARQLSLLGEMGADRAVAAAFRSVWFDYREGNAWLLEVARANPALLPAAVVNLAGYDGDDGYIESLRGQGFHAVALVSGVMGWDLQNYAFRELSSRAAASGLPLMLCVRNARDLVCAAEAAAPAGGRVLVRWMRGGGYLNVADTLALARDCPNFLFDVGTVTQSGGIADMVERLGDDRWFVASNLPQAHAGCAYYMLGAADLPAESRARIAGKNLQAVLSLDCDTGYRPPRRFDDLVSRPKIDTHWHTSGWNIIETRTSFESLSDAARRYGITALVTSSIRALSDNLESGNEETQAFLEVEPHARGLVVVNPRRPEASLDELQRYRNDLRFVGAKTIQDFYNLRLDSPEYVPILDRLSTMPDFPLMAHLPGLREAAMRYPGVTFVAAHSTWRHRELAGLPNVFFDIATSTPLVAESDIRDLIDRVGSDRVIFSADAPLMDPAFTLGKLASIELSSQDEAAIFGGSARRAFPRL